MHEIEEIPEPSVYAGWHGACCPAARQPAHRAAWGPMGDALLIKVQSERKPPYRKRYARRACERHADLAGRCLCP